MSMDAFIFAQSINMYQVFDLLGVGGLTPSGASQHPKFSLPPTGLVKNTLLTPSAWFYHKSSTVCINQLLRMPTIKDSQLFFQSVNS